MQNLITLIFFSLYSPCLVIECNFHSHSLNYILCCHQECCLYILHSPNRCTSILFAFAYKYTSTCHCLLYFSFSLILCNCCFFFIIAIHGITLCCATIKQVFRYHYTRSLNSFLFYVQRTEKKIMLQTLFRWN